MAFVQRHGFWALQHFTHTVKSAFSFQADFTELWETSLGVFLPSFFLACSLFLEESGSEWISSSHPEMWDLSEDRTDDVSRCVRCNFWAHSSLFPRPSHKGKPQKKCGTTPPDVPVVRDVFIFQVIKNSSGSGQQGVKERNGFICPPL